MTVNKHIIEEKTVIISKVAQTFGLADIYVFGSRAKEIASMIRKGRISETLSSSDVDIGIRTLPGKNSRRGRSRDSLSNWKTFSQ